MDSILTDRTPCASCGRQRLSVDPDLAGYGWMASCDNCYDGPGSDIGSGATAEEAIAEWEEQQQERLIAEHDETNINDELTLAECGYPRGER